MLEILREIGKYSVHVCAFFIGLFVLYALASIASYAFLAVMIGSLFTVIPIGVGVYLGGFLDSRLGTGNLFSILGGVVFGIPSAIVAWRVLKDEIAARKDVTHDKKAS